MCVSSKAEVALMKRRAFLASLAPLGLLAACGNDHATGSAESIAGTNKLWTGPAPNVDWVKPAVEVSDWVTHADQVAVFTVLSDATPKPTPAENRADGYDGAEFHTRSVRLRIDRTLWHRSGAPAAEGEIEITSDGILRYPARDPGKLGRQIVLGTVWIVPGHTYLAPLRHTDKGWRRMNLLAIPVVNGTTDANLGADIPEGAAAPSAGSQDSHAAPVVKELHGKSLDEVEAILNRAQSNGPTTATRRTVPSTKLR